VAFCFFRVLLPKCRAMLITYQLSERDFVEAYRTHQNRTAFRKWTRRVFFWTMITVAVLLLLVIVIDHDAQATRAVLPLFGLAVMWILVLSFLPHWAMRNQFRRQPGAHGPRTASLDTAASHWHWNGGSSDVEWKNYIRCVEGINQFLFYTSPVCFNILPKRTLASEQLDELRKLVKQNIQTAKVDRAHVEASY
jgi:hypothetical protein